MRVGVTSLEVNEVRNMETVVVDRGQALSLVKEFLESLAPGERVEISREDGTLIVRSERNIDPAMMDRVREVSERYHEVFQRLAES